MVCDGQQAERRQQRQAFEKVFERFYRPVSYFFAWRGFMPDECEDLAQETFLRAFSKWEGFRHENDDEGGWIFTIARHLYLNSLRRRRAKRRDVPKISLSDFLERGMDPADGADDPMQLLISKQERERVDKASESLPPRARQCFKLRSDQGLKYREIADVLQISLQSVRSNLHLAKTRIREILRKD